MDKATTPPSSKPNGAITTYTLQPTLIDSTYVFKRTATVKRGVMTVVKLGILGGMPWQDVIKVFSAMASMLVD